MNHFTAHATDWILLDSKQTFTLHLCYYDCVANWVTNHLKFRQ